MDCEECQELPRNKSTPTVLAEAGTAVTMSSKMSSSDSVTLFTPNRNLP